MWARMQVWLAMCCGEETRRDSRLLGRAGQNARQHHSYIIGQHLFTLIEEGRVLEIRCQVGLLR